MRSDDLFVPMMLRLFTVSETRARLERTRGASSRGGGEIQKMVWSVTEVRRITHSN